MKTIIALLSLLSAGCGVTSYTIERPVQLAVPSGTKVTVEQLEDGRIVANLERIGPAGDYESVPAGGVVQEISPGRAGTNDNTPKTETRARVAPVVNSPNGNADADGTED